MANYRGKSFDRNAARTRMVDGFNLPADIEIDWTNAMSNNNGELSEKYNMRYLSAWQRHFLNHYGGAWSMHTAKFNKFVDNFVELRSWVNAVQKTAGRNTRHWWVKDDSISFLKANALPIAMKDKVGKTDKRLSRLFGMEPFGGVVDTAKFPVRTVALSAAADKAIEGSNVVLGMDIVEEVMRQSIEAAQTKAIREERERLAYELRCTVERLGFAGVYITALHAEGEAKGIAIVRANATGFTMRGSEWKREAKFTERNSLFLAFHEIHATPLVVDVQNLAMHDDGRWDALPTEARRYFADTLAAIEEGRVNDIFQRLYEATAEKMGIEKAGNWLLAEFVASGGDVRAYSHLIKQAGGMGLLEAQAMYDRDSFPILNGHRRYIITDTSLGMFNVPRGEYRKAGPFIVVNGVDWVTSAPQYEHLHDLNGIDLTTLPGGISAYLDTADQDDLVIVYEKAAYTFVQRSPTMVGMEVAFCKEGGIIWPTQPKVTYTGLPSDTTDLTGFGAETAVKVVCKLMANGSAVGLTALYLRFHKTIMGALPAEIPASMSDITDFVVQHFGDARPIVKWAKEGIACLADQSWTGKPIPFYIAQRMQKALGQTVGFRAVEDPRDSPYHFDQLLYQLDEVIVEFEGEIDALARRSAGIPELWAHVERAEHSAKMFRRFYGDHFLTEDGGFIELDALEEEARQKFMNDLDADCRAWLAQYPVQERPDIVGAAVSLAYKKATGADDIHDYIGFQPATAGYLLACLRMHGFLGEPRLDEHKNVIFVDVSQETINSVHLTLYDVWAYGRGLNPLRCTKDERVQYIADDRYSDVLVGLDLTFKPVTTRRGERLAALDANTGCTMGVLPMNTQAPAETVHVEIAMHDNGKCIAVVSF
jgi:hypothetical protein